MCKFRTYTLLFYFCLGLTWLLIRKTVDKVD